MVFSSLIFLFAFFPLCLIFYFAMPSVKFKNIVLMLFSLFFYAWGEPVWVLLLILSSLVDFLSGKGVSRYRGRWQSRMFLIGSLIFNLGALAVFKYSGFLAENINFIFKTNLPVYSIGLPIGISFYTFQTMSYTIDVYRNKVSVQRSFLDFLLFVSLFPQLIAGPIVRYSDIAAQLSSRVSTLKDVFYGVVRFSCGLGKKVLLANYAGSIASSILDSEFFLLSTLDAWIGILMFAFQIYFDFSGYSDMAIGLGKIFGFKYLENFDLPYTSHSITEFWRRWHMSLGSFFRDYVYIPLGGNRRFQIRNMLIVWFLTGLWHGASWNFILWGLYFFVLLLLEKYLFKKTLEELPKPVTFIYCFFLVLMGWVLFYYTDPSRLLGFFPILFGASANGHITDRALILLTNNIPLIIICILAASPFAKMVLKRIVPSQQNGLSLYDNNALLGTAAVIYCAVILFLSTASLVGSSYNPFLYFRF